MSGGAEFDAIRAMLARWGALAKGVGDDAAVFSPPPGEQLVFSTDASVEDVHFRAAWLSPEEIGARATTAALSDLAAMGARALAVLVALEVPVSWQPHVLALADGIGRVVEQANATIIGGNMTRGERLSVTLTVIGATDRPVYRRGARVGDALWVTGRLGGPRHALEAWIAGATPAPDARARFAAPVARLREGAWLAAVGARAMIDISDGLWADAGHLAAASGVQCELWLAALPTIGAGTPLDALSSGEEYELLVATDPDLDADGFARRFGVPLTRVGVVRAESEQAGPNVVLRESEHAPLLLRVDLPGGHDHFSA
jgi:thiamine-monophosphate kinase